MINLSVILVILVIGIIAGLAGMLAAKKVKQSSAIPAFVMIGVIFVIGVPMYLWGAPVFEFLESLGK